MNMNLFNDEVEIRLDNLSLQDLIDIHLACDHDFIPKLSSRVNIKDYCKKLHDNARIISIHIDNKLAGVLAIYCNDLIKKEAFISSVCISKEYRGKGLSHILITKALELVHKLGFFTIKLEVGKNNLSAVSLYKKYGFRELEEKLQTIIMLYELK